MFRLFEIVVVNRGCDRGRDRMVVGFETTYVISTYYHKSCGDMYSIQQVCVNGTYLYIFIFKLGPSWS
jgi:hypothetical protein